MCITCAVVRLMACSVACTSCALLSARPISRSARSSACSSAVLRAERPLAAADSADWMALIQGGSQVFAEEILDDDDVAPDAVELAMLLVGANLSKAD